MLSMWLFQDRIVFARFASNTPIALLAFFFWIQDIPAAWWPLLGSDLHTFSQL